MPWLEEDMRVVRIGSMVGAVAGAAIAVALISLVTLRPFSVPVNGFIENVTFRICPLFILGFSSYVRNWAELLFITIVGNAFLYGAWGAIIGLIIVLSRKAISR